MPLPPSPYRHTRRWQQPRIQLINQDQQYQQSTQAYLLQPPQQHYHQVLHPQRVPQCPHLHHQPPQWDQQQFHRQLLLGVHRQLLLGV
jgi:hypothetical protein